MVDHVVDHVDHVVVEKALSLLFHIIGPTVVDHVVVLGVVDVISHNRADSGRSCSRFGRC